LKYLLDTCVFLWFVEGNPRLSADARAILSDDDNVLGVSIITFWEMAIKSSIGKLALPASLSDMQNAASVEAIEIVPVTVATTEVLMTLPFHHTDPFDRSIIATAIDGGWIILTPDSLYDGYAVKRLW